MTKIDKHGLKINSKDLATVARETRILDGTGVYMQIAYNRETGRIDYEENVGSNWWCEWLDGWESICLIDYHMTQQEIVDIIAEQIGREWIFK